MIYELNWIMSFAISFYLGPTKKQTFIFIISICSLQFSYTSCLQWFTQILKQVRSLLTHRSSSFTFYVFVHVELCICYVMFMLYYVYILLYYVGHVWHISRVDAFRPKGHGFDSRSSRHVGTLGKSFTHSCLWRFCVNSFQHSFLPVLRVPLSRSGLEEAL